MHSGAKVEPTAIYPVRCVGRVVLLRLEVPCQRDLLVAMDCAAVQIAQLAGALRMLRIIVCDRSVCQFRWKLGRRSLITHIKTFAAHYCWHFLPSVVHILPGLLVGSEVGRCVLKLCCSISLLAPGGLHLPVFESAKFLPDTAAGLGIFCFFRFVCVFGHCDRVVCGLSGRSAFQVAPVAGIESLLCGRHCAAELVTVLGTAARFPRLPE